MSIQTLEPNAVEITPAARLLQQLIEQQGVKPINDLNELSALWPADDEPDEEGGNGHGFVLAIQLSPSSASLVLTGKAWRCVRFRDDGPRTGWLRGLRKTPPPGSRPGAAQ